jgi:hypothetical protein
MNETYTAVVAQLTNAGFRETEPSCFASVANPRVVGLAVCGGDPETWRRKAEDILRKETMRVALSWTRRIKMPQDGLIHGPKCRTSRDTAIRRASLPGAQHRRAAPRCGSNRSRVPIGKLGGRILK